MAPALTKLTRYCTSTKGELALIRREEGRENHFSGASPWFAVAGGQGSTWDRHAWDWGFLSLSLSRAGAWRSYTPQLTQLRWSWSDERDATRQPLTYRAGAVLFASYPVAP
jgi:hypothetical protein